jgi:hypothetical protein
VHLILAENTFNVRKLIPLLILLLAGCQSDPYAHLYSQDEQAKPHEPLLIAPLVRMGKITPEMTLDDVIAAVGKPDRRTGFNLEYLRFGYAVMATRKTGKVILIQCGDPCDKTSPLIKMFAGRTKEGIGMGSTRSEIIAAFGQPTVAEPWGDDEERLVYKDRGLDFVLADGKVHFLAVDFRKRKTSSDAAKPPSSQ